jgi:hypothetical protein
VLGSGVGWPMPIDEILAENRVALPAASGGR